MIHLSFIIFPLSAYGWSGSQLRTAGTLLTGTYSREFNFMGARHLAGLLAGLQAGAKKSQ